MLRIFCIFCATTFFAIKLPISETLKVVCLEFIKVLSKLFVLVCIWSKVAIWLLFAVFVSKLEPDLLESVY
jgi:hypothetical protein